MAKGTKAAKKRPSQPGRPAGVPRKATATPRPAGAPGTVIPARSGPARPRATRYSSVSFEPIPPEIEGIPFDRIPYVAGDLKRVAITGGAMIVLIIIATFIVPRLVS